MTNHLTADIPVKALIRSNDKILLVEEMKGRSGWALPGGRIHEGEQPIQALKREVKEEIGVEIEVGKVVECEVFISESGQAHFVVVFEATLKKNGADPAPDAKEIKDIKWVTIEEALGMELRNEYREIFKRLAK